MWKDIEMKKIYAIGLAVVMGMAVLGCEDDDVVIPMCECRSDQICENDVCVDSTPDISPVPEDIAIKK